MNQTKIFITFVAAVLLISFMIIGRSKAQTPRSKPKPSDVRPGVLNEARTMIPTGNGRAGMVREFRAGDDILACGPASPGGRINSGYQGNFVTIIFSFGQPRSGTAIGSWTVRSIVPASSGHPESVSSYFFDGTFTSGTFNATGTRLRNFDFHGRTTRSSGSICGGDSLNFSDTSVKEVRIWGDCENPEAGINFEVTKPGAGVFARGTFRHNVSLTCGNAQPSSVRLDLDRH